MKMIKIHIILLVLLLFCGNAMSQYRSRYSRLKQYDSSVLVAANDAPSEVKKIAKYICNGVDDDVEMQDAINSLPSTGGIVELSQGTYNVFDASVGGSGANGIDLVSNMMLLMNPGTRIEVATDATNGSSNYVVFLADTKTNVVICGGVIDGNQSSHTTINGTASYGIDLRDCTDLWVDGVTIIDVGTTAASSGYGIYTNGTTESRFSNIHFQNNERENIVFYNGSNNCVMSNCVFDGGGDRHAVIHDSSFVTITGCTFNAGGGVLTSAGVHLNGTVNYCMVSSCVFNAIVGFGIDVETGADYNVISGCIFYATTENSINLAGDNNLIMANMIYDGDRRGIYITGDYNNITCNTLHTNGDQDYAVDVTASADYTNVTNNYLYGSSTIGTGNILNANILTNAFGNYMDYGAIKFQTVVSSCRNISGGTVTSGQVVAYKPANGAEYFTTTTSQGDLLVFGMVTETVTNFSSGMILTDGYTSVLKADGTTDIAVGDFLCTFTTAGIAMKAASGDMAFAIAMEAYTTDDSNGVLNALLIKPRLLP